MKTILEIHVIKTVVELQASQQESMTREFESFDKCVEMAQTLIPMLYADKELMVRVVLNRHEENEACSVINLNQDGTIPKDADLSEL